MPVYTCSDSERFTVHVWEPGTSMFIIVSCYVQVQKALDTAKHEFTSQNAVLTEDMPKLYDGRIDYFQPSFKALIHAQVSMTLHVYDTQPRSTLQIVHRFSCDISMICDILSKLQKVTLGFELNS
jgi:hypothetical protein